MITNCVKSPWTGINQAQTHPTFCWRTAQCPHPGGAGACARGTDAGWSLTGSRPTRRHRSRPAAAPGSPSGGGRRTTSTNSREPETERIVRKKREEKPKLNVGFGCLTEGMSCNSPRSACFWAEWHESCSCSRTRPYRGRPPCSGWSDEAGRGPWGDSWTGPTGRLGTKTQWSDATATDKSVWRQSHQHEATVKTQTPSDRWNMASVPSARATSTRPFTCLKRDSRQKLLKDRRERLNSEQRAATKWHVAVIKRTWRDVWLTPDWEPSLWVWWSGDTSSSFRRQSGHKALEGKKMVSNQKTAFLPCFCYFCLTF